MKGLRKNDVKSNKKKENVRKVQVLINRWIAEIDGRDRICKWLECVHSNMHTYSYRVSVSEYARVLAPGITVSGIWSLPLVVRFGNGDNNSYSPVDRHNCEMHHRAW